jgi:hypothetical protein
MRLAPMPPVYANFLSHEGAEGVEIAYGERLTRLIALQDRIDPTNFFWMNADIPPSPSPTPLRAAATRGALASLPAR